jgi:hypothetical protein
MRLGINVRIGDTRALGKRGVTNSLGDGGSQSAIVLLGFVSESEEGEEDEGAENGGPSSGLEEINGNRALDQQDSGILEDARVSPVGV